MSGIFKAVKKTIKKIGKVIKKIGPALLIAAAVYFGGAYLMSSGAATAGAAGSVGTSFTKAGGVWKAFLSGMGNGTASQSAAAFAEASYQTSIGAKALPLSGQVAAGTSAVNALSNMGGTADAVKAGVDFARSSWDQAGGNPQGAWNIIFNGLNKTQAVIEKAAISGESATPYIPIGDAAISADPATRAWEAQQEQMLESGNMLAQIGDPDAYRKWSSGLITDDMSGPGLKDAGEGTILDKGFGKTSTEQGGLVKSNLSGAQAIAKQSQDFIALFKTSLDDSRAYNQQILADRNRIAQQQMWMQGTGMLLSAIGASEDTLEEKKDKRKMAWKPSGKEEYASGAGKMYPGGLLA